MKRLIALVVLACSCLAAHADEKPKKVNIGELIQVKGGGTTKAVLEKFFEDWEGKRIEFIAQRSNCDRVEVDGKVTFYLSILKDEKGNTVGLRAGDVKVIVNDVTTPAEAMKKYRGSAVKVRIILTVKKMKDAATGTIGVAEEVETAK